MANKDVAEVLGNAIGKVAREAAKSVAHTNQKTSPAGVVDRMGDAMSDRMKNVSGSKGLAAGVGIATLVPLAAKGAGKLARGVGIGGDGAGPVQKAGDKLGGKVKEAVGDQVDKAGGAAGVAKEAGKGMLPGGGGGKSKGMPGVGKGRRMPVQQDIDIGAPLSTVYNEWTQFEEWPKFMHRLQSVSQEDETHVTFKTKIWGISKEFRAEIVEQRPDERIKWKVTDGVIHNGVVTFHELGPRLTRVELNLDIEPGSLIEKAARGMRHVKRAVRADMARFKAYVLMEDEESGEWRGVIEDGDVQPQRTAARSSRSSSSRSGGSNGRSRSTSSRKRSATSRSGGSTSSRSGSSSSGGRKSSSSRARKSSSSRSSSPTASKRSTTSTGKSSTSRSSQPTASKRSTASGRKRSASSSNGSRRSTSSNGRSSSSRTRASSNARSSNGSSSTSARKRTGARS